ncbi:hypothetical protein KM043_013845 [Ampulex compressa]|nr:hypothetical protein KM043_013845 [Ampulex compressa]
MDDAAQKVCATLPSSITNSITTCANSEQYVINFLQNLLPTSDCKSIGDELRKTFIFNKHRAKSKQKLKQKKKLLSTKKRMELGLRKVGSKDESD